MSDGCWERTEIQFKPVIFVRNVVVLFLVLYHVFKRLELLSFDSPAETDKVRRFPTSTKIFMSASAGN